MSGHNYETDFKHKYLKYKQKYKNKLNQIGGDNLEAELYDYVNLVHTFTVKNNIIFDLSDGKFRKKILDVETFYKVNKENILNFTDKILDNHTLKSLIENKSRFNGYMHCCWGNTVISHGAGNWDNSCCVIVTPLRLQRGRIYRISPSDTMILDYLNFDTSSYLFINESQEEKNNHIEKLTKILNDAKIIYDFNEIIKNKYNFCFV